MLTLKKRLIIVWLAMTGIALALSFKFNALIGLGVALIGLVIILAIIRKYGSFESEEGENINLQYKCMNCGYISASSLCDKCGSKIAKFHK